MSVGLRFAQTPVHCGWLTQMNFSLYLPENAVLNSYKERSVTVVEGGAVVCCAVWVESEF
jgi:hypothetical protein